MVNEGLTRAPRRQNSPQADEKSITAEDDNTLAGPIKVFLKHTSKQIIIHPARPPMHPPAAGGEDQLPERAEAVNSGAILLPAIPATESPDGFARACARFLLPGQDGDTWLYSRE